MASTNEELIAQAEAELVLRDAIEIEKELAAAERRRKPDETPTALDTVGQTALEVRDLYDAADVKDVAAVTGAALVAKPAFNLVLANPILAGWTLAGVLVHLAGKRLPNESAADHEIRLRNTMEGDEYESLVSIQKREDRIRTKYRDGETN